MGYILAIDVGKGTEDILLWDGKSSFENAIQLVAPSRTQLIADKLQQLVHQKNTIYIAGELMAGEPWHKIVYEYLENPKNSVIMTETSAKSLRYNLDQVRARGVKIVADAEFENDRITPDISTADIAWDRIKSLLHNSIIDHLQISTVLLCCQDHGDPQSNTSTRDYRMRTVYKQLDIRGDLSDLLMNFEDLPQDMPRYQAICQSAWRAFPHLDKKNIWVMDSSPAVVLGAIENSEREIVVNVGNGHTIIVALAHGEVEFAYELHTGGVDAKRIERDLGAILDGSLTHEEVLENGGHGLYSRKTSKSKLADYLPYTLIGPNRKKLFSLKCKLVHPIGNMMMAGPYGLIRAWKKHSEFSENST